MPVRKTFVDDKSYNNIELGAGCGDFGQQYYPKCLITDSDDQIKTRCDKNHVHFICPAHKVPVSDGRFNHVIMCNPWGYGFQEMDEAEELMKEVMRILATNGRVVIVCNTTNKYCAPHKVKKKLAAMEMIKGKYKLTEEDIDHTEAYPGYKFQKTCGFPATPNKKITIDVTK